MVKFFILSGFELLQMMLCWSTMRELEIKIFFYTQEQMKH